MTVLIDDKLEDPLIKDKKVSLLGGAIFGQKISMGSVSEGSSCEREINKSVTEQICGLPGSPIHRWSYQLPFINHFETIHTGPLVSLISHGGLSVGLSLRESL
ncbi:hypothetical protein PPACK8108_LOCUS8366 [Phakopsora pachyrhizi]|uniref:Uncharacterized protein n=1 Tax=Phakopsora pachyrhizi TaxID=170000 RepID=A0AAV0AX01_PHAPC|nr:hypothetical protein PPACK8108_LOCUS8366 [Phakopsora pachyrhizi]